MPKMTEKKKECVIPLCQSCSACVGRLERLKQLQASRELEAKVLLDKEMARADEFAHELQLRKVMFRKGILDSINTKPTIQNIPPRRLPSWHMTPV